MAKNCKLPKGIRVKGDRYEARAMVSGVKIDIYSKDLKKESLDSLIKRFELAKTQAINNIDYKKEHMTVNDWFQEWFDTYKRHRIKETSIYTTKNRYNQTFGYYLGSKKLNSVNNLDVQKAMNALESSGRAVSTIRSALSNFKECMEAARINHYISDNPCLLIEVPWQMKTTEEEMALEVDEQRTFLRAIEGNWYKEMFYFMFLTGCRVGEVGAIKWNCIDFNKKQIRIQASLSCSYENGTKRIEIVTPKTANSVRVIPFIGEIEEMLKSQLTKQQRLKKELGERWRAKGKFENLVFCTTMGSQVTRYIVQKEIKKIILHINMNNAVESINGQKMIRPIRDFHPHTIRHTFATRCFERGMSPKVVQKLMGHANITITLTIYTHVMESKMLEESQKFGNAYIKSLPNTKLSLPNITNKSHS